MRQYAKLIVATSLALAAAALATMAGAEPRYRGGYGGEGYVVAESRWGHGTVSGPVRRGPHGLQVRTPGGNWIDCVRNNCRETLRLKTVDLFETMGPNAVDGGPGYFRYERRF